MSMHNAASQNINIDMKISSPSSSHFSSTITQAQEEPLERTLHPQSLVPKYIHDPDLLTFVSKRISGEFEKWVAQVFTTHIRVGGTLPSNASMEERALASRLPPLEQFIIRLVNASNATAATLLATLVYLERLCAVLPRKHCKGTLTSRHRVFIATFIIAYKYLNDCGPSNEFWAGFVPGTFSVSEVTKMECELLKLLSFRLHFTEQEACKHLNRFLTVAQQSTTVDNNVPAQTTTPQRTEGDTVLLSSSSASELSHIPLTRAVTNESMLSVHQSIQHRFSLLPNLSTGVRNSLRNLPQQKRRIFYLSTSEASLTSGSNSSRELLQEEPRTVLENSRSFSGFGMNKVNSDLTLVSSSQSLGTSTRISKAAHSSSNTTLVDASTTTSGNHIWNSFSSKVPRLSSSRSLYLSDCSSLSGFNNSIHLEGNSTPARPSAVRNSLDVFRKLWNRHGVDSPGSTTTISKPPMSQEYGSFHQEIPYHISRPPLREYLRSLTNPDPVYESMAVC